MSHRLQTIAPDVHPIFGDSTWSVEARGLSHFQTIAESMNPASPTFRSARYKANRAKAPVGGRFARRPFEISGGTLGLRSHHEENDDCSQPATLFRLMTSVQQQKLFGHIADAMQGVPQEIVDCQLTHFDRINFSYGEGVRKALRRAGGYNEISLPKIPTQSPRDKLSLP